MFMSFFQHVNEVLSLLVVLYMLEISRRLVVELKMQCYVCIVFYCDCDIIMSENYLNISFEVKSVII